MTGIDFGDIVRPFFIYMSHDYHPSFTALDVSYITDTITCVIWVLAFPEGFHSIMETTSYSPVSMTALLEHA